MGRKRKLNILVTAVGTVVAMGGYVGDLYPNAVAAFGAGAIFVLGFAVVQILDGN